MMIVWFITLLLCADLTPTHALSIDTVYFQTTRLSVFDYYPNVQLFEVTVPQSTNVLKWTFFINLNDPLCPPSLIKFHYQHGGYPLIHENNRTFPANYRLARTASHNVTLTDVGAVYMVNVTSPLAGRWFAGAYLNDLDNHEVVKKIGARTCVFSLQMNVSVLAADDVQEISTDEALELTLEEEKHVFSFPVGDSVWAYTVAITGCTVANTADVGAAAAAAADGADGADVGCPVVVYAGDGGIPDTRLPDTKVVHCNRTDKACSLRVLSPRIDQLQYITILRTVNTSVTFSITISTSAFGNSWFLETSGDDDASAPNGPASASASPRPTNQKTAPPKVSIVSTSDHPNDLPLAPSQKPGTVDEQARGAVLYDLDQQEDPDQEGEDRRKRSAGKNEERKTTSADENENHPQTNHLDRLLHRKRRSKMHPSIAHLDRLENPDSSFDTVFSASPFFGGNQLLLEGGALSAVAFSLLPAKDQGGTLVFTAQLNASAVSTTQENVTVIGCLSPNRLPVNASDVSCSDDFAFSLSTSHAGRSNTTMLFPYPEAGTWYLVMTVSCFDQEERLGCLLPFYPVLFELSSKACDQGACGDELGTCSRYYTGTNLYSACSCQAKYRGYGCTDGSKASSLRRQLTDTLLLVLSNLMFVPSIGVATARRYYTEALVYLANMVFSTLYHACDMGPWSRYRLCVMPYHVLSYCDFFASILSIWVTLVAAAALPPSLTSLAHMAGALSLAMAVEWHVHGLWHNVVPIAVGVLLIAISWGVRCRRLRGCYPVRRRDWLCLLPGLALAGFGFATFAFLETDANYPYTHSAWHFCMALSVVFLLPLRRKEPCTIVCEDSSSSYELDFPSESVNLVPANHVL